MATKKAAFLGGGSSPNGQRKRIRARVAAEPLSHPLLLKKELELEKILVAGRSWGPSARLITELDHALRPHVHEGVIPRYGAIVSEEGFRLPATTTLPMAEGEIELGRKLADGTRSFATFVGEKFIGLTTMDAADVGEATLVGWVEGPLRRGSVVTSDGSGFVRVVYPRGVAVQQHRRWREKPMIEAVISKAYDCAPMVPRSLLKQLLSFAYHTLSPARVGATLVWWLQNPVQSELDVAGDARVNLSHLGLNVGTDAHRAILLQLLSQTDGASFVAPDGCFLGTGAHLRPSGMSTKLIPQAPGTRHTSARRVSFDCASALVVTVSADGPVSLFSDGMSVIELDFLSAARHADALRGLVPEKQDDVEASRYEATCSGCGKTMDVHEVLVYGWREDEDANCPICGCRVASGRCFRMWANVRKKLPSAVEPALPLEQSWVQGVTNQTPPSRPVLPGLHRACLCRIRLVDPPPH